MFKMKLTSVLGNSQGFCRGKSVFFLICVSKLLPRQNCLHQIFVKIKKIYIYINFSRIPVKSQRVWQNLEKYISVYQICSYCIFLRRKVWQKYCLVMQKKNSFVEFHHFMKKERLSNSSKTFLNQWEPMGFCKLQTKKMWGNFHDKIETCWLSSFFLNLSTGEWEQNREREKIKGKNNSHHS